MMAIVGVGSVLGVFAIWRSLSSRNGLDLDALGTVSRDWIASHMRRAEVG